MTVGDQSRQKYLLTGQKCGDLENVSKEYEDAKENNKTEKQIGQYWKGDPVSTEIRLC